MLQFLKTVCLEFVPSDVRTCSEFLPSGGFLLWTLEVRVTALKGCTSGLVPSFQWVRGLAGLRSEAADLRGVTAHKGGTGPESKQQQDLLQTAKEQSNHGVENAPQGVAAVGAGSLLLFLSDPTHMLLIGPS